MDAARMIQGWLWDHYAALTEITPTGDGGLQFGCGLMAMPSMHLTVVSLYVLFFWNEGRYCRWAAVIYAALVFMGSLYSGWHYAIDGYVGFAIAYVCRGLTRPAMVRTRQPASWSQATPSGAWV